MNLSGSSPGGGTWEPLATIVLDACVLLNLCASGRISDVLTTVARSHILSGYVSRERLWYLAPGDQIAATLVRRAVALGPLIAARLIEVVELTPNEMPTFIALARDLGDGEAASGAIAVSRSAAVATDDRKARQMLAHGPAPVVTIGTAALLRAWEASAGIARAEIVATIDAIRVGARFEPRRDDPDVDWWHDRRRASDR